MSEFGESGIAQTTLASMFPISYATMRANHMVPRTPLATAPLPPERVRSLMAPGIFSLNYSGQLRVADINTELLFLARALCSPLAASGGAVAEEIITDITFNDVTIDDVTTPLVIQGMQLKGDLRLEGAQTLLGSVQVGYCAISGSLHFGAGITLDSLELYGSQVTGDIVMPVGPSITQILVYGQYARITLDALSNAKVYPNLKSLLYLNGIDGRSPRNIPVGAVGFGAFTLEGLTQTSYPHIQTLAVPDPWSITNLEDLFPNLLTLYALGSTHEGALKIPANPRSRYSTLNIIDAQELQSLNLSERAANLSGGIRIVGCPKLYAVMLRSSPTAREPPQEFRSLVIERSGLLYLRGVTGLVRAPAILRLGDNTGLPMIARPRGDSSASTVRLLNYILNALPNLDAQTPAAASDYLPNVITSLEAMRYPLMQTVEYTFLRSTATLPEGAPASSTFVQYAGGSNPVVPLSSSYVGSTLSAISVSASPFGLRYSIQVSTTSPILTTPPPNAYTDEVRGSTKGALFSSIGVGGAMDSRATRIWIIVGILILVVIVIVAIILARYLRRRKDGRQISAERSREQKRTSPVDRMPLPQQTQANTRQDKGQSKAAML